MGGGNPPSVCECNIHFFSLLSDRSMRVLVVVSLVSWLIVLFSCPTLGRRRILSATHRRSTVTCDACQGVLGFIVDPIENKTAPEILKELDKLCNDILPSNSSIQRECLEVSSKLDKTLADFGQSLRRELFTPFALCTIISYCHIDCCGSDPTPQQVYLAYLGVPGHMGFTWITPVQSSTTMGSPSLVKYGHSPKDLEFTASGSSHTYHHGGWVGTIHSAVVKEHIDPRTRYYYQVGSDETGWSEVYTFKSAPMVGADGPFVFVNIGDMGAEDFSNETIAHLSALAEADALDVMLHDGDISYADGFQRQWDIYGRKIQNVSARIPYMVVPGNHEAVPFDFGTFEQRFQMLRSVASGSNSSLHWSFDYGNVHVLGINTESNLDVALIDDAQLKWIEQDLAMAQANRHTVPWIIVMGHRPFYTSGHGGQGIAFSGYLRSRVEDLFYKYKVDLVLGAHIHNYERTYAVYQSQAYKSYDHPPYPVYVINGAAGNREGIPTFTKVKPEWSASRLRVNGYGEITVHNATTLVYNFIEDENKSVVDTFTLVKG